MKSITPMSMWLNSSIPAQSMAAFIAIIAIVFLVKLYRVRTYFRGLQRQGLAMPPHHPILGHLPLMIEIVSKLPRNAHAHYLPEQIRRRYPDLGHVYYVDAWPFAEPVLVTTSPDAIAQYSQASHYLPRHPGVRQFMRPITGGLDLASMEGQEWKVWRKIFNPGFSAQHMIALVPSMLEELGVFRNILKGHAEKGDIFSLDEATVNASMDIIGRVTFDDKFNAQLYPNELTSALRDQIRWCLFGSEPNIFDRMNPMRPIRQWYNTRRMDRYLSAKLQQRYATRPDEPGASGKTIVDLAFKGYLEDLPGVPGEKATRETESTFHESVISQVKLFIFGGHDTTASTICYLSLLLSRNPSVLEKVRAEHDSVFGPDPGHAISMLSSQPHLLNQLPYTLAVIKETLRLFPVASSPRAGRAGFEITDSQGRQYPTENCLVWGNHHGLHNNPLFWPRVEEFLPERFLVEEGHPFHPIKHAWRPFESAPRGCIGQELALTELKAALVVTAREFDISPAYGEWDKFSGKTKPAKMVNGERAYQIQMGNARPNDGFPATVKLAEKRHESF